MVVMLSAYKYLLSQLSDILSCNGVLHFSSDSYLNHHTSIKSRFSLDYHLLLFTHGIH